MITFNVLTNFILDTISIAGNGYPREILHLEGCKDSRSKIIDSEVYNSMLPMQRKNNAKILIGGIV